MENKIIDGKTVAKALYQELQEDIIENNIQAKLQILLIGDDPGSIIYINQKLKAAHKLGLKAELKHINDPGSVETADIIELVNQYNQNRSINGLIVQLPLPAHISKEAVIQAIDPLKDVDGITPQNMGLTLLGEAFEYLTPCTATGVVRMLKHYDLDIESKHIVVIGAGNIAGKPIAIMMMNRGATVTILNSKTSDLSEYTCKADIVIVAVGKPMLLTAEMIKAGAVIIDVGISRLVDGSIAGDSDFKAILPKAAMASPVPGGVGKMTVASLMYNLVKAYKFQNNIL